MSPEQFLALWGAVWPYIATICMIASAIDAAFPQPSAGSHWLPIRKLISFVALNISAASNGAQPSFTTWLLRIVQPLLTAQGLIQAANASGPAKLDLPAAQVQAQPDPAPQSSGGAVGAILLAMLLSIAALSACSSADDVQHVVSQANASVAEASQDLPKACAVVSGLHAAFEVAVVFSPEAAEQADTERAVYLGLTTTKGLCSPETLANPPADVGGAVASIIKQSLQIQAMLKPAAASAVK